MEHTRDLFSQKYIRTHFTDTPHATKHHQHHSFWPQNTCQKQPKRGPGRRHTRPARGSVSHELSTPQGKRASPKPMPQKHLKSLAGQTTYATKQQSNPKNKSLRKSPTCLAIRALLCCVCISASLSGTYIRKDHTDIPTIKDNIPISTPTGNDTQTVGKAGPNTRDVNKLEARN